MKIETITCECGTTFEWENNDEQFSLYMRPDTCQDCLDRLEAESKARAKIEADRKKAEWLESFMREVQSDIPPIYQRTDTEHPQFRATAWATISKWEPTAEKPWLGLTGGTGKCKTRIAYLAAKMILQRLAENESTTFLETSNLRNFGPTYEFTTSYTISEKVMAQFGGKIGGTRGLYDERSPAQRARDWLDRIRGVDVLLIDDLGKGKLSPAVAAEVFALIDHRHEYQRVTIWTSNSSPEQIAGSLTDDMGPAFARRIYESSKTYSFK